MQVSETDLGLWLERAARAGLLTNHGFRTEGLVELPGADTLVYTSSVRQEDGAVFALLKVQGQRILGCFYGPCDGNVENQSAGFSGSLLPLPPGGHALFCPLTHGNAQRLREVLPFTAPSSLADIPCTFGLGDRLGVAGPGQLRAIWEYQAAPVLAQQSLRELQLTGRDYEEVLDAATWAVFQEGYTRPWGADGDHLKTEEWVRKVLRIGFTMITADVSDAIRGEFTGMTDEAVLEDYAALDPDYRRRVEEKYLGLNLALDTGEVIGFSRPELARTALIYREALEHADRLYRAGRDEAGDWDFDFELSIDETPAPTTPQAHAFIALEAQEARIRLSSLAPRFIGEFQKGIDYRGDQESFEGSFRTHAALARKFGYRLSVHSGSDKFSIFPIVGVLTRGRFHIKTAGTHWLEAVKVIARTEPAFYRTLHSKALERFGRATAYYHISANPANLPALSELEDDELPELFENEDARQLIHITYGEILSDPSLRKTFFFTLERHMEAYWAALIQHIGRHLDLLKIRRLSP